jgi:hypothetical protein
MDRASLTLAEDLPEGIPNTLAARAAHTDVSLTTLSHRRRRRRSMEAKADSQRYLTPHEGNAVVEFLLQQKAFGQPVRMKHMPSIAFSATRNRPLADRPAQIGLRPSRDTVQSSWQRRTGRRTGTGTISMIRSSTSLR